MDDKLGVCMFNFSFCCLDSHNAKQIISLLAIVGSTDAKPIKWPFPLNSIHKNHNNPQDNGVHSLILKAQIPKISSKGSPKLCHLK